MGTWPLKILMFALLVTLEIATYSWPCEKTRDSKYMLGLLLMLISKCWGWPPPPPGLGMPFLDRNTCAEGGAGGGGIFISPKVFFLVWCHPWMDGWKASRKTTTTSLTICNTLKLSLKVTLSLHPILTHKPCFIPNLSVAKWGKLGVNSQDLQNFTKTWFNKEYKQEGRHNRDGKIQNWG